MTKLDSYSSHFEISQRYWQMSAHYDKWDVLYLPYYSQSAIYVISAMTMYVVSESKL